MLTTSTPIARRLARVKNIDLNQVKGTGPLGRILVRDIENFQLPAPPPAFHAAVAQAPVKVAPVPPPATPVPKLAGTRQKVSTIRKTIANALKNSWNQVAYCNSVSEVDVSALWKVRSEIKDELFVSAQVKVTFLAYILKATAIALKEFPVFNAKYDPKTEELVYHDQINISIGVDTPYGLMVPVIKGVDQLNLIQIAKEIARLAKLCRDRTIKGGDLQNSTFTITNYGTLGSLFGVPVINFPEIAILGAGAIKDRPVVIKNEIKIAKIMYLTLAADHRWVDGADMSRFCARITHLLEKPSLLGAY